MTRTLPLLLAAALLAGSPAILASSHRDAPLISEDPAADNTDVYTWVANEGDGDKLVVLANYVPFAEPAGGPNFHRFADDVRYEIHITNPTTGQTQLRYDFQFSDANPITTPGLQNPDSLFNFGDVGTSFGTPIVSLGGPALNFRQTYTLTVTDATGATSTIATDLQTGVPNVGNNVTFLYNDAMGNPVSGATAFSELDALTQQAVHTGANGHRIFAGPRDEGFYADVGSIFDFLDVSMFDNDGDFSDGLGQDGGGKDAFAGYNVMSIAIEIPLAGLPSFPYTAPITGAASNGVGVYAAARRPRILLRTSFSDPFDFGPMVQVSRMGNPLTNELIMPLVRKDAFNRSFPTGDATSISNDVLAPEIARVLAALHPPFSLIQQTNRTDLAEIFVPDVIKVDTTTGPVPLPGQVSFDRLGAFGGDTTGGQSSGWPNGRRIGDDVVDIALTALFAGPGYPSDLSTVEPIGDNVQSNDQVYHQVLPYLATPHPGRGAD